MQGLDAQCDELRARMQEEDLVNTELENYLKETHKKLSLKVRLLFTADAFGVTRSRIT